MAASRTDSNDDDEEEEKEEDEALLLLLLLLPSKPCLSWKAVDTKAYRSKGAARKAVTR